MKSFLFFASTAFFFIPFFGDKVAPDAPPAKRQYYIIIDKSKNILTLYDEVDWVLEFPCTFGSDDKGDKLYQGDRRTPEGSFTIISMRPHNKWHKMMMLDYPTATDMAKFSQRKAAGVIPSNAKIGGGIAIHGTWPREEFAVEYLQNWTLGCISMRNDHLDELYNIIGVGTRVFIRR